MNSHHGSWSVDFAAAESTLRLRHAGGAVLSARLSFACGEETWTIGESRDAVPERLALIDGQRNVQGYLHVVAQGSRLQILVHHRTAQFYSGTLRCRGTATLGNSSFACRTAAVGSPVVQLAAGPADSALNDSLFDIATDTALRFAGDRVSLRTEADGFAFEVEARIEDAAVSALVFELLPDFYRSRYVPYYAPIDKRRCPSPPTGWMSWNTYFDQAGAEENLAEARIGAEHLQPFGLDIWSIESWQGNSDKLPVSSFHNLDLSAHATQFPEGMGKLAGDIRALGFRPGIWTAPFGTGDRAFYEAHKPWFLHQANGEPFANWSGRYLLDPSQPEVRDHTNRLKIIWTEESAGAILPT